VAFGTTVSGIAIGGPWMPREGGVAERYVETPAMAYMNSHEIKITVELGKGRGKATVWTCDLALGCIYINGSCRS
jgi:glutamate N-acetyltransferase/amino-acid N-acetyltransferase